MNLQVIATPGGGIVWVPGPPRRLGRMEVPADRIGQAPGGSGAKPWIQLNWQSAKIT
jgi:hypothetical protein